MTPERYQRIGQLFDEALELAPEQRVAWLDQACGADLELRGDVGSLLANHTESEDFLARPAMNVAAVLLAQNQCVSRVGQKLSHYEVLSLLGVGGMGEVYLAEDTLLGRRVALKVLATGLKNQEERLLRLEQEARAASALNHPNILTIYESGEANGVRFIAAEYVGGETLRIYLERDRFTISETLDIAEQLTAALDAAHRAGIVHRDVKPENVVLRKDGLVKLLDFGIAKLSEPPVVRGSGTDEDAATRALVKTNPGMVMGTVSYMSPEQVRGHTVDARADEWSLGVMLYEMLSGRLPFSGETVSDTIASILKTEPEPLADIDPAIPGELQRIVLKTLRKDPEERYQNTRDLLIDLRDLKHDLDFQAKLRRTETQERLRAPAPAAVAANSYSPSPAEILVGNIKLHRRGVVLGIMFLSVLTVATVLLIYSRYSRNEAPLAIDSVAVMPFVSQGLEGTTEYLQDGLTESLIMSLSRLPQLRVMARTSIFRYKGREVDPQAVGSELGVRAVLTGRIMQQGDDLIISVELVNVADGTQLWGERYSRRNVDLLAMQQLMAREISQHLQLRLSGEQERQLHRGGTTDNEAYQLYLRGRYAWNKRTADEINRAIKQFRQAIDRDPNYGLAYVGLADCYMVQGSFAGTPMTDVLSKAKAALQRALQVDESIAEAHASKGFVHIYSLEWDEAESEFQRAIALNPNYATAHHWYSEYFRIQRRFVDQAREVKLAQELDPLSPSMAANLGRAQLNLGELDEAVKECKRALDLNPNFPLAHHFLGLTYVEQQRYEEAIAEFQQAVAASKRSNLFVAGLGIGYAAAGKREEAVTLVSELEEKYAKKEATGFDVALVHAALGNNDEAIDWLEKDFALRNMSGLVFVASTFIHHQLRNDLRYQNLLQRMRLDV